VNVRPNSPDLHVARKTIGGDFEDVVRAVQPIKHQFIIDAGGYIGTVSIVLSRAFPTATIVTIEPSRENFEILKKNTAKYANITIINAALGSQEGKASFYDRGAGPWGYSLLKKSESGPSTKARHDPWDSSTFLCNGDRSFEARHRGCGKRFACECSVMGVQHSRLCSRIA
jgi:hypothetical protein